MCTRRVDDVIVVVHSDRAPTDEEWTEYIDISLAAGRLNGGDLARCKMFVFTDGGSPSVLQRIRALKAAETLRGALPIAVITASVFVRALAAASKTLNLRLSAWDPERVREAFAEHHVTPETARAIWLEIQRMEAIVGRVRVSEVARAAYERALR